MLFDWLVTGQVPPEETKKRVGFCAAVSSLKWRSKAFTHNASKLTPASLSQRASAASMDMGLL